MAFKPPPALLTKLLKFKALEHKDGRFMIWKIPAIISQTYSLVYLQRLIEKRTSSKEMITLMHNMGRLQAQQGYRIISERFGYAKTIQDKINLLKFNLGQTEIVGLGRSEVIRADFVKMHFIFKAESVFAKEYIRFFGMQKSAVDHFLRGASVAYIEELTGKKMVCIETSCVAKGDKYCEFVVKPATGWDKKDKIYKEQEVKGYQDLKSLGAKIEPYLITNY